ncbi:MAG: hypothetical protein AAGF45_12255 [Pseudomonadota bacterium]
MRTDCSTVHRSFHADAPRLPSAFRATAAYAGWERHYVVSPGHALSLIGDKRIFLTTHGRVEGMRTEEVTLDATFPLDWMSRRVIADVLPRRFRHHDIDGRDAQRFVDSIADPEIIQASLYRDACVSSFGSTTIEFAVLTVPTWNARTVSLTITGQSPYTVRAALNALGATVGPLAHADMAQWLTAAHHQAYPPKPERSLPQLHLARTG